MIILGHHCVAMLLAKMYEHLSHIRCILFLSVLNSAHNSDTFRELLTNNIDLFRTHIKQYSHCHRIITK